MNGFVRAWSWVLAAAGMAAMASTVCAEKIVLHGNGDNPPARSGGVIKAEPTDGGYIITTTAKGSLQGEDSRASLVDLIEGLGDKIGSKDFKLSVSFKPPKMYPLPSVTLGGQSTGFGILARFEYPDDDDEDSDPETETLFLGWVGGLPFPPGVDPGRTGLSKTAVAVSGSGPLGGTTTRAENLSPPLGKGTQGGMGEGLTGTIIIERKGDAVQFVYTVDGEPQALGGFSGKPIVGSDLNGDGVADENDKLGEGETATIIGTNTALAGAKFTGLSFLVTQDKPQRPNKPPALLSSAKVDLILRDITIEF